MKTRSILKLAAFGAMALGVAFGANTAKAQTDFDAGVANTININAAVDNTITATVVEPDFGNIGVVASLTPGEQAILEFQPAGTFNTAAAVDGDSRLLVGGGSTVGSVTVAAGDAFPTTPVYVTYSNAQDLTCALCTVANPDLIIHEVTDNLGGGAGCGGLTAGVLDVVGAGAADAQGCELTAGDGSMAFNLGVTIATVDGVAPRPVYETGVYLGSVDVIIEY